MEYPAKLDGVGVPLFQETSSWPNKGTGGSWPRAKRHWSFPTTAKIAERRGTVVVDTLQHGVKEYRKSGLMVGNSKTGEAAKPFFSALEVK